MRSKANLATLVAGLVAAAGIGAVALPMTAEAAVVPDCTAAGPTAADTALAARVGPTLTAKLAGSLSGGEIGCARVIVQTVKSRGLAERAATIAITASIVESSIHNLGGGDQDSLGLFQERPSSGWGTAAQIEDPVYATNAFLDKMVRVYPNSTWMNAVVGDVDQAVEVSAYPDRYQPQASDGGKIANALWNTVSGARVSDYDGDGADDLMLYRPNASTGSTWWASNIAKGTQILSNTQYGGAADIALTGDFNGDGYADLATYRRDCTNGSTVWVKDQHDNVQLAAGVKFGGCNDIPVVGDFDGDGTADIGLYRRDCTNGSTWWAYSVSKKAQIIGNYKYGGCADIPVAGDYNGDGKADLALYRPDCTNGSTWWVSDPRNGQQIFGNLKYGGCHDVPVAGDFTGDGASDLALYRKDCTNGSSFWVYSSLDRQQVADLNYGGCNDVPAPGDYDGDGTTDLGLYRADCTNGSTFWAYSVAKAGQIVSNYKYGGCADVPATSTKGV